MPAGNRLIFPWHVGRNQTVAKPMRQTNPPRHRSKPGGIRLILPPAPFFVRHGFAGHTPKPKTHRSPISRRLAQLLGKTGKPPHKMPDLLLFLMYLQYLMATWQAIHYITTTHLSHIVR
jgi:hypothetical protein